jgi:hypothetical protein
VNIEQEIAYWKCEAQKAETRDLAIFALAVAYGLDLARGLQK